MLRTILELFRDRLKLFTLIIHSSRIPTHTIPISASDSVSIIYYFSAIPFYFVVKKQALNLTYHKSRLAIAIT